MHVDSRKSFFGRAAFTVMAKPLFQRPPDLEPEHVSPQAAFGLLASAFALEAGGMTIEGILNLNSEELQVFLGAPKKLFPEKNILKTVMAVMSHL